MWASPSMFACASVCVVRYFHVALVGHSALWTCYVTLGCMILAVVVVVRLMLEHLLGDDNFTHLFILINNVTVGGNYLFLVIKL